MIDTTSFNRIDLVNELHARPFIGMEPDSRILCIVLIEDKNQAFRNLKSICDNLAIEPSDKSQNFYLHESGTVTFKWERHSEFTSYMLLKKGVGAVTFGNDIADLFPMGWHEKHQRKILTSMIIEISPLLPRDKNFEENVLDCRHHFSSESLASASILDGDAMITSDFKMDQRDHVRFLIAPKVGIGPKRIGRIAQRLIEIETYKTASMLGLPIAREANHKLSNCEERLSDIMLSLGQDDGQLQVLLEALISLSVEVEATITSSTFRFSAAAAYSEIVSNRIEILREERIGGRQLFSEFMLRRYEPSMRTIISTWERLREFSKRVERASNLLRTRVDVRNAQNQQELLTSMNARAETQLRLQETVEGFSVVAISYYAISLLAYLLAPIAKQLHIDKAWLIAMAVIPTVFIVRHFVHRVKDHINKH